MWTRVFLRPRSTPLAARCRLASRGTMLLDPPDSVSTQGLSKCSAMFAGWHHTRSPLTLKQTVHITIQMQHVYTFCYDGVLEGAQRPTLTHPHAGTATVAPPLALAATPGFMASFPLYTARFGSADVGKTAILNKKNSRLDLQ